MTTDLVLLRNRIDVLHPPPKLRGKIICQSKRSVLGLKSKPMRSGSCIMTRTNVTGRVSSISFLGSLN